MTAYGNIITITNQEQYEQLLVHPASISGWFSPQKQYGEVAFATPGAAVSAWRTLH